MSGNLGVGTVGARIGFVCTEPAHLDQNGTPSDHLTIHDRAWAYCPRDARAGGHEWKPTGGVPLTDIEMVVRGMRIKNGNGNGGGPKVPANQAR